MFFIKVGCQIGNWNYWKSIRFIGCLFLNQMLFNGYCIVFSLAGKPKRSYSGSKEWRATEWIAGTIMRAACERSKGGGCSSPRQEGGRHLPFTAGLARFFAWTVAKARVADERNGKSRCRNGAMPGRLYHCQA